MTRVLACAAMVCAALGLTLTAGRAVNSSPPPAVQAVVPYNGAVYNGPPGLTPEQGRALIALLESIDTKLDYLPSIDEKLTPAAGKAKAAAPKVTWQQVVAARCAACHGPKAPKGDFILVGDDKAPKPLNVREWTKIVEAVQSEHMPPPEKGKLLPAEKAVFKK